jgi:hypothetical protein
MSALDARCRAELGSSLQDILNNILLIHELQKLMEGPLYAERFAGMLRATTKEDPMDCTYVRRCVIDWLKQPEEYQRFKELVKMLAEKL